MQSRSRLRRRAPFAASLPASLLDVRGKAKRRAVRLEDERLGVVRDGALLAAVHGDDAVLSPVALDERLASAGGRQEELLGVPDLNAELAAQAEPNSTVARELAEPRRLASGELEDRPVRIVVGAPNLEVIA